MVWGTFLYVYSNDEKKEKKKKKERKVKKQSVHCSEILN